MASAAAVGAQSRRGGGSGFQQLTDQSEDDDDGGGGGGGTTWASSLLPAATQGTGESTRSHADGTHVSNGAGDRSAEESDQVLERNIRDAQGRLSELQRVQSGRRNTHPAAVPATAEAAESRDRAGGGGGAIEYNVCPRGCISCPEGGCHESVKVLATCFLKMCSGDDPAGDAEGGSSKPIKRIRNIPLLAWFVWFISAGITAIAVHFRLSRDADSPEPPGWGLVLWPVIAGTLISAVLVFGDTCCACYMYRARQTGSAMYAFRMQDGAGGEEAIKAAARSRLILNAVALTLSCIVLWLVIHVINAANAGAAGHWTTARQQAFQAMFSIDALLVVGVVAVGFSVALSVQERAAALRDT